MLKKMLTAGLVLATALTFTACGAADSKKSEPAKSVTAEPAKTTASVKYIEPTVNGKPLRFLTKNENAPIVYYTKDVSAKGLMKVYKALGQEKKGKVAIKVSFGAEGEQYLDPVLMAELVKDTQGTFVDTNGFTPPRHTAKGNYGMAEKHGFTKVGPVDILDADGDIDMPVEGGHHLKFTRTGSHIKNYDTFVAVHRFKTHYLPQLGGNIKNISLSLGSISGKALIHSAGKNDRSYQSADDDTTARCFADAAKAALDFKKGRWAFINVLDAFRAEDKCAGAQDRKNIGILASLDPVAVDQASVDFEFGTANDDATRAAWEKYHSVNVLEFAEKINAGKRHYRMVSVD